MKTKKKIMNVIVWLLVILLLIGAVGAVLKIMKKETKPVEDASVELTLDKASIVFGSDFPYLIEYEVVPVRGSGLDYSSMVDFKCVERAKAGERVTFTYSTSSHIMDAIALYGVGSGFLCNLTEDSPPSSGTLSFVMPEENVYVLFSEVG